MFAVSGSLQNPNARPWRVAHFDEDIGHMKLLSEVNGQTDVAVLKTTRQGRTLPPLFSAINCILRWMRLNGVSWVAVITCLSLNTNDLIETMFKNVGITTLPRLNLRFRFGPASWRLPVYNRLPLVRGCLHHMLMKQ